MFRALAPALFVSVTRHLAVCCLCAWVLVEVGACTQAPVAPGRPPTSSDGLATELDDVVIAVTDGACAQASEGDPLPADAREVADGQAEAFLPANELDAADAPAQTIESQVGDIDGPSQPLDAATVGTDETTGLDTADAAVAEGAGAALDVSATATGLQLTVQGGPGGTLNLHILALPAAAMAKGDSSAMQDLVLLASAPGVELPWSATVTVPAGQWGIGVAIGPASFAPTAIAGFGFGCADGQPMLVQSNGATTVPQALGVTVAAAVNGKPFAGACGADGKPDPNDPLNQTVLEPVAEVAPPSTQAGGAHLLSGIWIGGALWVAGHQDAFVRFDMPMGAQATGLAGWQPQGQGECSRLFRFGSRLWCSSRRIEMAWAQVSVATGQASTFGVVNLPSGTLADGLAAAGDRIVIAAHSAGLASIQADPPFAPLALPVDAKLADAWDVAAVGPSLLAVADGAAGLTVFQVGTPLALSKVATLALPGLSAMLAVHGTQVAVTSPTGQLHIVDLAQPAAPKVLLAWQAPGPLWGLAPLPGAKLGVVAAGNALVAFEWPGATATWQVPVVRDVERVWHHALDVDPLGTGQADLLVSSEFGAVRQIKVAQTALGTRTLLLPKAVFAKATAPGGSLAVSLTVRNLGTLPAQLTDIVWHEDPQAKVVGKPIAGLSLPQTVPAGGKLAITLALPKLLKGELKHELKLHTSQGLDWVQVIETTHLRPGDPLPKLAYQSATGQLVDVNKTLAGKPGVVVVAAHACPMALVALSGIATLVEPWVAQGKLKVVAIDPWDKPGTVPQIAVPKAGFPVLFSPLTTTDSHAYSALLEETLAQPANNAAPMPLVYVVDPSGIIVDARLGWEPATLLEALASLGIAP